MKFRAAFFLFIVLTSLGSSWVVPMNISRVMDCCHKESPVKECTNQMQNEKRECDKDYCNPFLTCSTTPVMVPLTLEVNTSQFILQMTYPETRIEPLRSFAGKHWQPPKLS